ncbi:MAG: glycosyltransferase family 2 protein [Endozoicomonas sp.]
MNTPLFSVIIPAYNYAHTLSRAVDSVLAQSSDDMELFVINDGSTDNTPEIIDQLRHKHPDSIQVIDQENRGLAATRNRGVDESQGTFLIFLDADDELTENALDSLRQAINDNPSVEMIIGAHISVQADGQKKQRTREPLPDNTEKKFRYYLLEEKLSIANGATAMHRKIFQNYRYPEHFRCVEDISMFSYVLANYECITLNKPIAYIHKHDDSMRNNIELELSVGLSLVDEIFSPDRLPNELLIYRSQYETMRYLGIFRTLYLSGDYRQALSFYAKAIKKTPTALLRASFLRKAIRATIHSCFRSRATA